MTVAHVGVIGSSGGGAATLGHTQPSQLLQTIHNELQKIENGAVLSHALFVSLHGGSGLDTAHGEKDFASLYSVGSQSASVNTGDNSMIHVNLVETNTLSKVNQTCRRMDSAIAKAIRKKKIQGLILISIDIDIHADTLKAASDMKIPVTGSGGSSLSAAAATFGIRLAGNAGGSVATTSYTRAVSYAHALATAWQFSYSVFSTNAAMGLRPQWKSVLNSCLPAFWAICLACRGVDVLNDYGVLNSANPLPLLRTNALPTTCCIVMATSCASHHGSTVAIAASIASMACSQSILSGLIAGWIVAFLVGRVLYRCVVWGIPATMTNLLVAGGVGTTVAILIAPLVPLLCRLSTWVRWAILKSMEGRIPGIGFLFGCLFCYGSKVGYYHALCLPLILLEMELGGGSLWGAMDVCTLVVVSAGVCSANLLTLPSTEKSDRELCGRAVWINLLCGDFVEAAYPYMEQSMIVNLTGYLASGLAVEMLTKDPHRVLSSAYMPVPASILLATDSKRMALACAIAFGVSFSGTFVNNILFRTSTTKKA